MNELKLSFAVGNYDRVRPLLDARVQIDGVEPTFMLLQPEEIFFRAFRHEEFDVCECSLSTFTLMTGEGTCPYIGLPAFLSRGFRHAAIYIRKDRGIHAPADLRGKRIGLAEYQLTANVWVRGFLKDQYGVDASEILWVRGGLEDVGRVEKVSVPLPAGIRLEEAGNLPLNSMLASGEIDGFIGPRAPSCFDQGHPMVGWLFDDPQTAARSYFESSRAFPIMHLLGVRRALVKSHPWLPATLLKAFSTAKSVAVRALSDTAAANVTLPFVGEQVRAARDLLGDDYWPYGVEANRKTLDLFLKYHHEQGLSKRKLSVEELFHPTTLESSRI